MLGVGVDVSKEKSTLCILKPYSKIVVYPLELNHTKKAISEVVVLLKRLVAEVRIIMETTGNYHLPVLTYLKENGFFVSVANPLVMRKYPNAVLRKEKKKTDKLDSTPP